MADANPLATFPQQTREAVEGLMYLGYLEDHFEFAGHRIDLRTLYGNEELNADLVCKEYIETTGQARAYAWSRIALAVTAIDGQEDFCPPIGPNELENAKARFRYFTQKWFWPMADLVFQRYSMLQQRQVEAFQVIQDLSQRSLGHSTPSPSSLNEQGDSSSTTAEETPS